LVLKINLEPQRHEERLNEEERGEVIEKKY
jgi:hypothetical protein